MKKILLIGGLVLITIVSYSMFFFSPDRLTPENPAGKKIYYTVIHSEPKILNDEERYEYHVVGYDKKGNEKDLHFTASKILKDGAYLELYTTTLRGVTYWQEIQYEQLPKKLQKIFSK